MSEVNENTDGAIYKITGMGIDMVYEFAKGIVTIIPSDKTPEQQREMFKCAAETFIRNSGMKGSEEHGKDHTAQNQLKASRKKMRKSAEK